MAQISTKYFYVKKEKGRDVGGAVCGPVEFKNFFSAAEHQYLLEPISFQPDIYCEPTIDDYKNGKDIMLETAINNLKKVKKR